MAAAWWAGLARSPDRVARGASGGPEPAPLAHSQYGRANRPKGRIWAVIMLPPRPMPSGGGLRRPPACMGAATASLAALTYFLCVAQSAAVERPAAWLAGGVFEHQMPELAKGTSIRTYD